MSGHFAHYSYFPRLFGAQKNTMQLAKYPRVLFVKPSNKVYLSNGFIYKKQYFFICFRLRDRTDLNCVPDHVLLNIFSYLSVRSLCQSSQVRVTSSEEEFAANIYLLKILLAKRWSKQAEDGC